MLLKQFGVSFLTQFRREIIMSYVMQAFVDGSWKNINRGKNQYSRTWSKIKSELPIRVVHSNGSMKVTSNGEKLEGTGEALSFVAR